VLNLQLNKAGVFTASPIVDMCFGSIMYVGETVDQELVEESTIGGNSCRPTSPANDMLVDYHLDLTQ
jgi:hypothetical protein